MPEWQDVKFGMRDDAIQHRHVEMVAQKLVRERPGVCEVHGNRERGKALAVARDQRRHVKGPIGAGT